MSLESVLLDELADHEAKQGAWYELLGRYREKSLLPGIGRELFEAALKMGFDEGWRLQRQASIVRQTQYDGCAGQES